MTLGGMLILGRPFSSCSWADVAAIGAALPRAPASVEQAAIALTAALTLTFDDIVFARVQLLRSGKGALLVAQQGIAEATARTPFETTVHHRHDANVGLLLGVGVEEAVSARVVERCVALVQKLGVCTTSCLSAQRHLTRELALPFS
ncbi:MAG TPA: hypothetical protein VF407_24700 [Polyangiaceae bacterium]